MASLTPRSRLVVTVSRPCSASFVWRSPTRFPHLRSLKPRQSQDNTRQQQSPVQPDAAGYMPLNLASLGATASLAAVLVARRCLGRSHRPLGFNRGFSGSARFHERHRIARLGLEQRPRHVLKHDKEHVLEEIVQEHELITIARALTVPGKGLLAMDESPPTLGKRFQSIGVDNTEENRRRYRELLLSTKGLGHFISGAILHQETVVQTTCNNRKSLLALVEQHGIIPGVKVDAGLAALQGGEPGEFWTQGLDGLKERAEFFFARGVRFAKWRAVVRVRNHSQLAIAEAAHGLGHFASICQSSGLVPVVETEILLDGEHSIDECLEVYEATLTAVFKALVDFDVMLEAVLLKPSMVMPGSQGPEQADPTQVAAYTLAALRRHVPPAVPGIMFLSGGQTEVGATLNLNAINKPTLAEPWLLSFSYSSALQGSVLAT
ncbi:unnamed protein product [Polarella glacialis]|nr:unnamed protein product [Polarella glacialis]